MYLFARIVLISVGVTNVYMKVELPLETQFHSVLTLCCQRVTHQIGLSGFNRETSSSTKFRIILNLSSCRFSPGEGHAGERCSLPTGANPRLLCMVTLAYEAALLEEKVYIGQITL